MRVDTIAVGSAVLLVCAAVIIPSVSASIPANRVPYYITAAVALLAAMLIVGAFASTRLRLVFGVLAAAVALPTGLYLGRIAVASAAGVIAATAVSFAWFCYLGHRSNVRNKHEA